MLVLLIRHAMTPVQDRLGQRAAISLSPEGELQATRLAERLKNVNLAAVFTSPLTRAVQTARAIVARREVPLIAEAALREVDVGEWDGRTFSELEAMGLWKHFNTFRSGVRTPGGEMMIEVQARIVGCLERWAREYGDHTIAAVSHADVIRGAICHYSGIPLDVSMRVRICHGSISALSLWESGAQLICLNDSGEWGGWSS